MQYNLSDEEFDDVSYVLDHIINNYLDIIYSKSTECNGEEDYEKFKDGLNIICKKFGYISTFV